MLQVYGFNPDNDLLEDLLTLNLELPEKEQRSEAISGTLGTKIKYHLLFSKEIIEHGRNHFSD